MTSPLRYPLSDIYVWAVDRSLRAGDFRTKEVLDRNHADCQIVSDDQVFGSHWALHHTYTDLAREIRAKVVRHSKYTPTRRKMPEWTIEAAAD